MRCSAWTSGVRAAGWTGDAGWTYSEMSTYYPKAIKVSDAEMNAINIDRDGFHGEWNYTISPTLAVPAGATTNLGVV